MLDYQGFKKAVNTSSAEGWVSGVLPSVSSVAYNGNRSYDITFAGPVTDYLSPGMRLKTVRQVAAPTQCTSLNGTTQYFNKTSPNKLTFTDDFVVSAWVKLNSYAAGTVASRWNGTSGWGFEVNASGQVFMFGTNNGGSNISYVLSFQSVPLNKWVHVAAQLDMSAFTATTTTSYVMIDGVNVPAQVIRGGTNPTSLIQAGNLEIGSRNGGTQPFNGKIAQIAVFSAKVAQATIQGYISQGLSGSETSLASAYSFNGVATDINTTTPNDLTAQGSAVATNPDSPFSVNGSGAATGTDDYAIVTKISSTVATVQVPEGNTIPTSGGISATYISTQKAPYNMPINKNRWLIISLLRGQGVQSSPTQNVWYNLGSVQQSIPIGDWTVNYNAVVYSTRGSGVNEVFATLSTASNSEIDRYYTSSSQASPTTDTSGWLTKTFDISLSTTTLYYLNSKTSSTSVVGIYFLGDRGDVSIISLPSGL